MEIPKKIWFLWLQGKEEMPLLIKYCYESWCTNNPDYEVIFLDKKNLNEFVAIDTSIVNYPSISHQALSDVIRINLLNSHGGIWVDANCYCLKALDSWISSVSTTGFFAYEKPGPDRMISSWFLIGEKNNIIINELTKRVNNYWIKNKGLVPKSKLKKWKSDWINHRLEKYDRNTSLWFSFFTKRILKVYPYYYFHYLFYEGYKSNKQFKNIWDRTTKISGHIPLKFKRSGYNKEITEEFKAQVEEQTVPLLKLTQKSTYDRNLKNSSMSFLLNYHEKNIHPLIP